MIAYTTIMNWNLEKKVQTGGVSSQRDDAKVSVSSAEIPEDQLACCKPHCYLHFDCGRRTKSCLPCHTHWGGTGLPGHEQRLHFWQHPPPGWDPIQPPPEQHCAPGPVVWLRCFSTKSPGRYKPAFQRHLGTKSLQEESKNFRLIEVVRRVAFRGKC